jgi:hypothetical protein
MVANCVLLVWLYLLDLLLCGGPFHSTVPSSKSPPYGFPSFFLSKKFVKWSAKTNVAAMGYLILASRRLCLGTKFTDHLRVKCSFYDISNEKGCMV